MRDIAEILEHWQTGRSICAISRSLDVSRATIRKYVYAAEARGYRQGDPTPPQGWKAFIADVRAPRRETGLTKLMARHNLSPQPIGRPRFLIGGERSNEVSALKVPTYR